MNKKMKILIGILIVIAGIIILLAALKKGMEGQIMDGDGMEREPEVKSVTYFHGGGSLGDLYRLTLESGTLTVESCEGNGSKTKTKKYSVDEEVLFIVSDIAWGADMKNWTDLPPEEFQALDAASTSLSLDFADGTSIYVSSSDKLPEGGWDAVNEIRTALEACITR